jgi:hypothetical protein
MKKYQSGVKAAKHRGGWRLCAQWRRRNRRKALTAGVQNEGGEISVISMAAIKPSASNGVKEKAGVQLARKQ